MKLVHLTTVPQSLGFLRGQAGFMKARGFEVHAISSPGVLLERFREMEEAETHAVQMARRITPLRDAATLLRVFSWLMWIRPAIVQAHTPKAGLIGMVAAAAARVPVRIFHLHGLPHSTAVGLRRLLLKYATRAACLASHRVLCVSSSVSEAAVAEGLVPEWKIGVPAYGSVNGVDATGVFNPARLAQDSRDQVKARYGIPGGSLVLGFAGRLVRDKGLVELLKAWAALREVFCGLHLLLAGDTEPHDPLPQKELAELREDPRIHVTGWSDNMAELYGAMDLLVLPSYREGFPVAALEAAAMSLPIVATRVPGCVDAVKDGVTGALVEPRDSAALDTAIRRYLRDPERRAAHGRAGRQRVLRDFQPADVWRATEREYVRLLCARGIPYPPVSGQSAYPAERSAAPAPGRRTVVRPLPHPIVPLRTGRHA